MPPVPRMAGDNDGVVVVVIVRFFNQDCDKRLVDNINTQYGQQLLYYE